MQSASDMLGGLVLITAELYQWMPLKDACLRHCRAPPGLQCSKSTLSHLVGTQQEGFLLRISIANCSGEVSKSDGQIGKI